MSRAKTSYSTTIFSLNFLNNHNPNGTFNGCQSMIISIGRN